MSGVMVAVFVVFPAPFGPYSVFVVGNLESLAGLFMLQVIPHL